MVRFDTTQWCHGLVRFRYGGRPNVGYISVLNHESEPMDIKHTFAPGFAHMQTKCKIYAGEHLNQSFHYEQKVKAKTKWSNGGAFAI